MANVMFKRGSQSALQKLITGGSFTEGTFETQKYQNVLIASTKLL